MLRKVVWDGWGDKDKLMLKVNGGSENRKWKLI